MNFSLVKVAPEEVGMRIPEMPCGLMLSFWWWENEYLETAVSLGKFVMPANLVTSGGMCGQWISVSLVLFSSIIGAIHFHWSVSIDRLGCNLAVHHCYKYPRQLANKEDSCVGYGFRSFDCDLVYLLLLRYPVSWWESMWWVQVCSLEVKSKRRQQSCQVLFQDKAPVI